MASRQYPMQGLPPPEPKVTKPTSEERLAQLEERLLTLELEVTLLKIQMEKGARDVHS